MLDDEQIECTEPTSNMREATFFAMREAGLIAKI
jgi:hypothetical protein